MKWLPIATCPENETVLFFCEPAMVIGKMERDVPRQDGSKKDLFWGYLYPDENTPTHWMHLPDPPIAKTEIYKAANEIVNHLGAEGEITSRHDLTLNLLHALNDFDNAHQV